MVSASPLRNRVSHGERILMVKKLYRSFSVSLTIWKKASFFMDGGANSSQNVSASLLLKEAKIRCLQSVNFRFAFKMLSTEKHREIIMSAFYERTNKHWGIHEFVVADTIVIDNTKFLSFTTP